MEREQSQSTSVSEFLRRTKVKNVMLSPAVTIGEEDRLSEAQFKFTKYRVNHLVVVDETKRIVGVISQKYLYRAHSPRRLISDQMAYHPDMIIDGDCYFSKEALDGYILRQVMKRDPFFLNASDSLADAVTAMASKNLAFIPVIDENHYVVGALTDQEIIAFFAHILR